MHWFSLLKAGDWLVLGLGALLCVAVFPLAWNSGTGEKVIVRRAGAVFSVLDLSRDRRLEVQGPLGVTTVLVDQGRVRVLSDPGPRQYCIRQGWLTRAGEVAICAPNQVSVEVQGQRRAYDSLAY